MDYLPYLPRAPRRIPALHDDAASRTACKELSNTGQCSRNQRCRFSHTIIDAEHLESLVQQSIGVSPTRLVLEYMGEPTLESDLPSQSFPPQHWRASLVGHAKQHSANELSLVAAVKQLEDRAHIAGILTPTKRLVRNCLSRP